MEGTGSPFVIPRTPVAGGPGPAKPSVRGQGGWGSVVAGMKMGGAVIPVKTGIQMPGLMIRQWRWISGSTRDGWTGNDNLPA